MGAILDSTQIWFILTVRRPRGKAVVGHSQRWLEKMTDTITQEMFAHLVDLAALQLTPKRPNTCASS